MDRDAQGAGDRDGARGRQIGVVVVDDHLTLAELLGMAVDDQEDLHCLGHAGSVAEGMALVDRVRPDVVVLDVTLGDGDGLRAAALILSDHPRTRVVMLTAAAEPYIVQRAAAVGACAFLAKSGDLARVLDAIRHARPGHMMVDPQLLAHTSPAPADGHRRAVTAQLTPSELLVLQHLALGLDARRIAKRLSISLHTSRGHIKAILSKLHCHSQIEALAVARRLQLIHDAPVSRPARELQPSWPG